MSGTRADKHQQHPPATRRRGRPPQKTKAVRREAAFAVKMRRPHERDWFWAHAEGGVTSVWWERALMTQAAAHVCRDHFKRGGGRVVVVTVWRKST